MQVYKSRHTPGATGDEVHLHIGERVLYTNQSGETEPVAIASERMAHKECDKWGYVVSFPDGDFFVSGDRLQFNEDSRKGMW